MIMSYESKVITFENQNYLLTMHILGLKLSTGTYLQDKTGSKKAQIYNMETITGRHIVCLSR